MKFTDTTINSLKEGLGGALGSHLLHLPLHFEIDPTLPKIFPTDTSVTCL